MACFYIQTYFLLYFQKLSHFILPFLNPYLVSLPSSWVLVLFSLIFWISSTLSTNDCTTISGTHASLAPTLYMLGPSPTTLRQALLIPHTACYLMLFSNSHSKSTVFSAQGFTLIIFFSLDKHILVLSHSHPNMSSRVPVHSSTFLECLIKHGLLFCNWF